jgi:hypothetical protein
MGTFTLDDGETIPATVLPTVVPAARWLDKTVVTDSGQLESQGFSTFGKHYFVGKF